MKQEEVSASFQTLSKHLSAESEERFGESRNSPLPDLLNITQSADHSIFN